MELLFFNCIISGMFPMTCRFMAFSLIWNAMKKPSSCCLSPLAHRIIYAWHDSGPDLQSAPTPWMLVASLPLEALNCFWLALPAWFSGCLPGSCLCVVIEFVSRGSCSPVWLTSHSRGSSAVWWSFYVWYCTRLPQSLLCSTVLLPSWLKPYWYSAHRFIVSRIGRVGFFHLLFPSHFLLWQSPSTAILSFVFTLFLFSKLTPIVFSHFVKLGGV